MPGGGGGEEVGAGQRRAAARGVDPERDAKGGSNPKPVPVTHHRGRCRRVQEGRRAARKDEQLSVISCQFKGVPVPAVFL